MEAIKAELKTSSGASANQRHGHLVRAPEARAMEKADSDGKPGRVGKIQVC